MTRAFWPAPESAVRRYCMGIAALGQTGFEKSFPAATVILYVVSVLRQDFRLAMECWVAIIVVTLVLVPSKTLYFISYLKRYRLSQPQFDC